MSEKEKEHVSHSQSSRRLLLQMMLGAVLLRGEGKERKKRRKSGASQTELTIIAADCRYGAYADAGRRCMQQACCRRRRRRTQAVRAASCWLPDAEEGAKQTLKLEYLIIPKHDRLPPRLSLAPDCLPSPPAPCPPAMCPSAAPPTCLLTAAPVAAAPCGSD